MMNPGYVDNFDTSLLYAITRYRVQGAKHETLDPKP